MHDCNLSFFFDAKRMEYFVDDFIFFMNFFVKFFFKYSRSTFNFFMKNAYINSNVNYLFNSNLIS